ncbi:DUF3307 domain-containing protein [Modicisalibacter luteus]|uniref:DUF3307 domain-containing protein n=1 Tax=Modicisalibacter luteus TaxID=453962 RepID=UPI003635F9BF
MMTDSISTLLALLMAHLGGDFLLQGKAWVQSKKSLQHRSPPSTSMLVCMPC